MKFQIQISECFRIWQNGEGVKTSSESISDKYCIMIKAKIRYINPLVETDDGVKRIGDISSKAKSDINTCLDYSFDRYVYMDFNFNNKS